MNRRLNKSLIGISVIYGIPDIPLFVFRQIWLLVYFVGKQKILEILKNRFYMIRHVFPVHEEKKSFECERCEKSFHNKSNLIILGRVFSP